MTCVPGQCQDQMSSSISDLYTAGGNMCSVPTADEEGAGTTELEHKEKVVQRVGIMPRVGHSANKVAELCRLLRSLCSSVT